MCWKLLRAAQHPTVKVQGFVQLYFVFFNIEKNDEDQKETDTVEEKKKPTHLRIIFVGRKRK